MFFSSNTMLSVQCKYNKSYIIPYILFVFSIASKILYISLAIQYFLMHNRSIIQIVLYSLCTLVGYTNLQQDSVSKIHVFLKLIHITCIIHTIDMCFWYVSLCCTCIGLYRQYHIVCFVQLFSSEKYIRGYWQAIKYSMFTLISYQIVTNFLGFLL